MLSSVKVEMLTALWVVIPATCCVALAGAAGEIGFIASTTYGKEEAAMLRPGDRIDANVMTDKDRPATVLPQIRRLKVQDKIRIKFILDPALNQDITIPPDGMITLQGVGRIRAAGLMPDQLAEVIAKRYLELNIYSADGSSDLGIDPFDMVRVSLQQANGVKTEE